MKSRRLKTQLFSQTIIYITVVLICLSAISSYFFYQSSKESFLRQNDRLLSVMTQQAKHFLIHPEEELKLIESTLSKSTNDEVLQDEVLFILRRFSYIYRIEHLDEQGKIIQTFPSKNDFYGLDYSRNPIYTRAKTKKAFDIVFGGTFIDPIAGHPAMSITLKARDGSYIVGYLNLSQLKEAFDSAEFDTIVYAILDNSGHYLLHPDDSYVLQRKVDSYFIDIKRNVLTSGSLVKYNNDSHILQYQEIPSTGWLLMIYQDTDEMITPILILIIIVVMALLFLTVIMSVSINSILGKVESILLEFIKMTKSVSRGKYNIETSHHNYIEFQELSGNFQLMIGEIESREEEINTLNSELENSYLETVLLLAKAIEAKDTYTGDHCDRVKNYALLIGNKIGLNPDELYQLEQGSLLHDIGKLNIPESILNKEGRLSNDEYELVKTHSLHGYELIKDIPNLSKAKDIVLYHHERIDGAGYPHGLKGNEIPLFARIVCIADAYDAMMSLRAYRHYSHTYEEAIQELKSNRDKQFDSFLVDIFINCLREERQKK